MTKTTTGEKILVAGLKAVKQSFEGRTCGSELRIIDPRELIADTLAQYWEWVANDKRI